MRRSHDPTYPLYPIFSFLGFVLCLIPLPWHIQAWNSGTCAFMIWTAFSCLIGFVNSLVWTGNVNNVAPVWCDISSKLILGASVGIPAATLCISRRLYSLTAIQTVHITRAHKRRMVIGDLGIAVGFPMLIMVFHYIVQGHRFDILEDIGCYPVVYNTLPAYFLYFMWPTTLGVISFIYSGLTLRSFWMRRLQFNQIMSSNSAMNMSRYLRLMLLASIDMMCTIPLSVYSLYIANKGVGLAPWISWEDTHYNFSHVGLVPGIIWRSNRSFQSSAEMTHWLPVICAFLFFALFGFASEATKHYKIAFSIVAKRLGFGLPPKIPPKTTLPSWVKPLKAKPGFTSVESLPVYATKGSLDSLSPKELRRNSFSASFTDSMELGVYTETDAENSGGLPSTCDTTPPLYIHMAQAPKGVGVEEKSAHRSSSPCLSTSGTFVNPSPPTSPSLPIALPSSSSDPHPLPQSHPGNETDPQHETNTKFLRTVTSKDRFYVVTEGAISRPPSPAPFADMVRSDEDRSLSPPLSLYPSFADAIQVTVHTEYRSTEPV